MHGLRHGLKVMWWLLCLANRKPLVDISVLLGILDFRLSETASGAFSGTLY